MFGNVKKVRLWINLSDQVKTDNFTNETTHHPCQKTRIPSFSEVKLVVTQGGAIRSYGPEGILTALGKV